MTCSGKVTGSGFFTFIKNKNKRRGQKEEWGKGENNEGRKARKKEKRNKE
jgi:hypothetical protein